MNSYWGKSQCIGTWLHKFHIYLETPQGVAEICERCKERVYFPVRNGTIQNEEYLNWHKRDFLFPQHPYFKHEYNKNYAK